MLNFPRVSISSNGIWTRDVKDYEGTDFFSLVEIMLMMKPVLGGTLKDYVGEVLNKLKYLSSHWDNNKLAIAASVWLDKIWKQIKKNLWTI